LPTQINTIIFVQKQFRNNYINVFFSQLNEPQECINHAELLLISP